MAFSVRLNTCDGHSCLVPPILTYFSCPSQIAKDSSGKDSEGSQLTTVQLWWKEFESEAKSKSISPQPTPEADPSQSYLSSEDPKDHWYGVSTSYWEHVDASDDGMLGGFASITNVDLAGSLQFLLPMIMGKESNLKSKVGNSKAIGTN